MRNILLAVTGLNPQVITEALFCLWQEGRDVHEIHVITTRPGKERILTTLLSPLDAMFKRFLSEYKIKPDTIHFSHGNLHVISKDGMEIDDILSEDDNEQLLKECLQLSWKLTVDPNTAVFFLVAGGRKTMTSCLTLAAQLYGRPQDRIYHVLVSPEFEACSDFWYPPRQSVPLVLKDKNGEKFYKETRYAQLQLIPIPFVSLRHRLSDTLLSEPHDPGTLISSLIREKKPTLRIFFPASKLIFGTREIDLHPARLALYGFFAEQKMRCAKETNCHGCTECFLEASDVLAEQECIRQLYRSIPGSRRIEEMSTTGITALNIENFNMYKSRIRRDLEKGFGLHILPELEIASIGSRPNTRYGICLERNRIQFGKGAS